MPVFRFILSWWGVFLQCLPRVPASLSCSLQTSAFVVACVQPPLTSKIFLTWGAAVHRLRLSHTVIKLKSWKYAFLVCFLIPFHPTRVPGFSPLMLIICTKNKTKHLYILDTLWLTFHRHQTVLIFGRKEIHRSHFIQKLHVDF